LKQVLEVSRRTHLSGGETEGLNLKTKIQAGEAYAVTVEVVGRPSVKAVSLRNYHGKGRGKGGRKERTTKERQPAHDIKKKTLAVVAEVHASDSRFECYHAGVPSKDYWDRTDKKRLRDHIY